MQPWNESAIMEELMVFKEHMYDGAGIPELMAGLECLSFITDGVELSDDADMFVGAAIDEASMRIDLMKVKDEHDIMIEASKKKTAGLEKAIRAVTQLGNGLKSIDRMMRTRCDEEDVMRIVNARIERRMQDKYK
jgi:hypothetical protein